MKYKNMLFAVMVSLSSINANGTELNSQAVNSGADLTDWVHSIIIGHAAKPRPIRH